MKTLLSFSLLLVLLFGCMDDSSNLTSPDVQINPQSTSPNWVKLPGVPGQGFDFETGYSTSKLIKGKKGGHIKLNVKIKRLGHEFGDFVVKAKVKVDKHSFPDNEERLFTINMDPYNAFLKISPSPNTLYKHIKVDWEIKGIDVSDINPDTFNFFYVGDNNEMLETSKAKLTVDYIRHKIKVKKAVIDPTTTEDTPGGARYGFTR
ncbi:MAG: hypothetical protein IH784_08450 [Bacteroidetes bacterium]|nr:hypothetical protein [Bacteroidota bacterium]